MLTMNGKEERREICALCGATWEGRKKEYVAIINSRPHIICATCVVCPSVRETHIMHVDVDEQGPGKAENE